MDRSAIQVMPAHAARRIGAKCFFAQRYLNLIFEHLRAVPLDQSRYSSQTVRTYCGVDGD